MPALNLTRIGHPEGYRRWMRYCIGIASVIFVLLFLLPFDAASNNFTAARFPNGFNNTPPPSAIAFADWQEHEAVLLLLDPSSFAVWRFPTRSQPLLRLWSSFERYRLLHTGSSITAHNLGSWPQAFNSLPQLTPILLC
jgi:hypothetical protein